MVYLETIGRALRGHFIDTFRSEIDRRKWAFLPKGGTMQREGGGEINERE